MRYQYKGAQHLDPFGEALPPGPERAKQQRKAVSEARNKLFGIRAEIRLARVNKREWLHPKDQAELEAEQAAKQAAGAQAERNALLYETVVEDFLRDEAFDDADKGQAVAASLRNRCSKAFAGKSWADLTQQDRERYTLDRLNAKGWFGGCKKVGPRGPAGELADLRRVGNYLMRCGKVQTNPFAVPLTERNTRSRKKARRSALHYTPARKPVLPSDDAVRLAFELCETGYTDKDGTVDPAPELGALIGLCGYEGGARPQSEACLVRGEDIRFRPAAVDGKDALGSVT